MKKAFTLVELMIVVVIIGILAVVAIPKFSDMVDKSKEGATKGQLTAIRGALQVYYSDNEGRFITPTVSTGSPIPDTEFKNILVPKYLSELAVTKLPKTECSEVATVYYNSPATNVGTNGGWSYDGSSTSSSWGDLRVNCSANDLKGNPWTSY